MHPRSHYLTQIQNLNIMFPLEAKISFNFQDTTQHKAIRDYYIEPKGNISNFIKADSNGGQQYWQRFIRIPGSSCGRTVYSPQPPEPASA